jgi:dTDP-glucose 4,6-dehydratase
MAKLLVTGGAGFIGTNYVRQRAAANPGTPIIVLDAMTYSAKRANIDDLANVVIVEGDIRDEALVTQLLRDHQIDTLVHFAAESHVDRSISGPDIFIDSNIVGTHSLLKAARAVWLDGGSGTPHRFHHISTDEVFGSLGADDPAFHEDTPYAPNSPYSASKAASDHLVRAYHHTYGLQTTMTNCSNNYGPYQFTEKLIPLFVINALTGKNLPVYGDGMNVRDWLHVDDHCRAIDLVLGGGQVGETYNVGGGEELPNMTVIKTICSTVDALFADDAGLAARFPQAPAAQGRSTSDLITYVTDRAGHDRRYAIDCRKLEGELGYAPAYDFAGGLAATIRWYVDHPGWWGYQTADK